MTVVVDTSAFVSLAAGDVLSTTVAEFDLVTTETVVEELRETAAHQDRHGRAAADVLDRLDRVTVVVPADEGFETSRIDSGEATCVTAARETDARFLVTDDFRALPELERLVAADVVLSPVLLRALVSRGALEEGTAEEAFDAMATERDWLEAPIHRYARRLFDADGS
ncbi:PIN domain-containing protein [Haloparvum sedimenti]|uniref:PIN domain-containing protein n=1 Tax=Haloparvum sedimenti TaxID=1678448 RepID=UPI00071E8B3E|nr:PIN domain-containing protein [Haloparvum sedimenti]